MKFDPENGSRTRYLYTETRDSGVVMTRWRASAVDIIQALRQNPETKALVLEYLDSDRPVLAKVE